MVRPIKWSLEVLTELAGQYENYSDFREKEDHAYRSAARQGVLDEITAHMVKGDKGRPAIWDEKNVMKEARGYASYTDFMEGSRSAYVAAHRDGHIEKVRRYFARKNKGGRG